MTANPLKWPQFEQLGSEFYTHLKLAVDERGSGAKKLSAKAQSGVDKVSTWLDGPCVATVKLDGTNLGVDSTGLVVGRNCIVEPGGKYQNVDVFSLLKGYSKRAARVRRALADESGGEHVAQVMLYGELLVDSTHDYAQAGVHRRWLCFGAMLRPSAQDSAAASRLALVLRASGFNTRCTDDKVLLAMNLRLATLLEGLSIPTVAGAYRPTAAISEAKWAEHDGEGGLAWFRSLRHLIFSPLAQRLLLPESGAPLGHAS